MLSRRNYYRASRWDVLPMQPYWKKGKGKKKNMSGKLSCNVIPYATEKVSFPPAASIINDVPFGEMSFQEFHGQGVFQMSLYRSFQWTRPKLRVVP